MQRYDKITKLMFRSVINNLKVGKKWCVKGTNDTNEGIFLQIIHKGTQQRNQNIMLAQICAEIYITSYIARSINVCYVRTDCTLPLGYQIHHQGNFSDTV